MTRLQELLERQTAIRAELLEIEELPEPTEEDGTRQDTLLGEYDDLETERGPLTERAERLERVRAAADAALANTSTASTASTGATRFGADLGRSGPELQTRTDPFENLESLRFDVASKYAPAPSDDTVSRAITALTDYRPHGVSDDELQAAVRAVETIPGAAQHALLHGSPAYRSAFRTWMNAQGQSPVYTPEENEAVRTAMSTSGANGGYTLPTLLDPTLIQTGTASKNPMRQISRVVSGTQNTWHGVTVSNVTSYWTAEAAAMTEGSPTFGNPSVTAAKLTAFLAGSFEVFEDSNLQGQLPGLIGQSFDYMESDAFIVGSGSNAPLGILTAISATVSSTVTATTRGSVGGVDIFNVAGALPSRYEDTAQWVAQKTQYNFIQQLSTASNGALYWTNLNQSTPPELLGYPIRKSSAMSNTQTSGSIAFLLGDFSQFIIYDRIGTSVEFVQNLFNSSGIPTGQRGLVAHKRVGSGVTDLNAFRFLKT